MPLNISPENGAEGCSGPENEDDRPDVVAVLLDEHLLTRLYGIASAKMSVSLSAGCFSDGHCVWSALLSESVISTSSQRETEEAYANTEGVSASSSLCCSVMSMVVYAVV